MEYRKFAEKAIEEIKAESPSYKNCEMLSWMYAVRKHCTEKLDRETAVEWVHGMENADGTTGPHWTMEKTEEARAQRGINCDALEFWVAMNMIYSDYAKVAEKVNANSMDFYVYMAKAFLEDKDARNQGGEKLARDYEYVVM